MSHLLGASVSLYVLGQAAAGTAASGNFHPVSHYGFTPRKTDPLEDDPIIGQASENLLDVQAPAAGLIDASFDIDLPLCFNQLGFWLPHLMRVTAPSGADPYTHEFKSGARSHAGLSAAWQEGSDWRLANTLTVSRLEIGLSPEPGRRRARMSFMASDIVTPASDPTGTPASQLALNTFPGPAGCKIYKSDVLVANLMGGSLALERTLVPYRPTGRAGGTALEFTPDYGSRLGGNVEIRPVGNVFYDAAEDKTADDWEFVWETDSDNRLSLKSPALRFEPAQRPVSGRGLRTENYQIRGEQTASAAAVTATLINAIDAYPVEV